MSYAGQQIDYAIVSKKNVNELEFLKTYGKLTDVDVVLDSFRYFKKHKLISSIFYFPLGHLVMAEFRTGTNEIIKKKNFKEPPTKGTLYRIDFFEILGFEGTKCDIKIYSIDILAEKKDVSTFASEFGKELEKHVQNIKFVVSRLN